jgi:hypothetical protein
MPQQAGFQTAVERLQAVPDGAKAGIGPKINRYLIEIDDLRGAIPGWAR